MHYFKRNIGDYHKKAGKLSMLEHGAYTLLLDAYYDRERAPTKQDAIEWCWARTDDEISAVEFVLMRFFQIDGEVYRQKRIDEEIESYKAKSLKNKQIAIDREQNKRTIRAQLEHEACTDGHLTKNQEPRTTNQEPETKSQRKNFKPPTQKELQEYCKEKNYIIDVDRFINFYESKGWMVGKNKMKSWKAAASNWASSSQDSRTSSAPISKPLSNGRV